MRTHTLLDTWTGPSFVALALIASAAGCTGSQPTAAASDDAAVVAAGANEADFDSPKPADATADADGDLASAERVPLTRTAAATPPADAASAPVVREAAKPVVEESAGGVPSVVLSAGHTKLCKVAVGDAIPTLELPRQDGAATSLDSLAGAKATVVVIWSPDRWMAASALEEAARIAAVEGVAVVGVAVGVQPDAVASFSPATGQFPQLIDSQGATLAAVGEGALPRVYVLDAQRRIAWFDIEFSEATRRELQQAVAALAK
jgi:peroxiredoxin